MISLVSIIFPTLAKTELLLVLLTLNQQQNFLNQKTSHIIEKTIYSTMFSSRVCSQSALICFQRQNDICRPLSPKDVSPSKGK